MGGDLGSPEGAGTRDTGAFLTSRHGICYIYQHDAKISCMPSTTGTDYYM